MKSNLIKGAKTTTIGITLFGGGVYYIFIKESPDYFVLSMLLISGVAFLLFPDDFILNIKKYLNKKSNE